MKFRALSACIFFCALNLHALPYWIWHDDSESTQPIRRAFNLANSVEIQSAPLRFIADAAHVELSINGQRVAIAEMFGPVIEADAKAYLKPGRNEIELRPLKILKQPAVALDIKVHGPNGQQTRFVTTAGWHGVSTLGNLSLEKWWTHPPLQISEADDYTQWKRASDATEGTDPNTFQLLPGFKAERLISAGPNDGSWVSLAFDPQGRLTIGREDKGLIRYTFAKGHKSITQTKLINQTLKECRGLLYAHDSLFVQANQSKGIFRLRDTNGDGTFDEEKRLHTSDGGFGHGRNALSLGPNGKIYAIHGDSIQLPAEARDLTSPLRRKFQPFRNNEGHVLRMNPDGSEKEIFCAGLRNPYGIAFNADGEAFTYDADAEFDMGTPWYRPTEVKHLTSGADFGWRAVTGSWPPYYPDHPDNTQATLAIGKGSPTGLKFGTSSQFPADYQKALFILDWTYGRILAVHLRPRGSTYMGSAEVFLRGQPLNLTDLDFGPDGALYFVTGGRKTQSALYRVHYHGPRTQPREPTQAERNRNQLAREYRAQRRQAERFHATQGNFEAAPNTPEPRIRQAWRIALEHNPNAQFKGDTYDLEQLTAQANLSDNSGHLPLNANWPDLLPSQQLAYINFIRRALERHNWPAEHSQKVVTNLAPHFPNASSELNQALAPLLIQLAPDKAVSQTMRALEASTSQRERIHYLHHLRHSRTGWTLADRKLYFRILNEYDAFLGGRGLPQALARIRKEATTSLTEKESQALAPELDRKPKLPPLPDLSGRQFVRTWKPDDFTDYLGADLTKRDRAAGQKVFHNAMCSRCHRKGSEGYPIGPDLTHIARRFDRATLLTEILAPSQTIAENYQTTVLKLTDNRTLAGQVVPNLDYREPTLQLAENPLHPDKLTKIQKSEILSQSHAPNSLMPPGLLNLFTKDEVLNLLTWLEASTN